MKPILRNSRGLTLLETVIVLVIAGMIVSAVWIAYGKTDANDRVARTVVVFDKTVQATRDYLSSQAGAGGGLSLSMKNLMPSELSYKGTNDTNLGWAHAGVQVFISPLGADYFVQECAGCQGAVTGNYFEIDVGFTNAPAVNGVAPNNTNICVLFMPQIIGNDRMINARGIIGYNFGNITSGIVGDEDSSGNVNNPPPSKLLSISSNPALQGSGLQAQCSVAANARFFLALRP